MKPSTAKAKGRAVENALVDWLRARGLDAERRRLAGSADKGDISGLPGVCVEVKSGGGKLQIPQWLRETETERMNAGADVGVLVIRPRGATDPASWWAVQPLLEWVELAQKAGYLEVRES
jgi:hypothetical protein